MEPGGYNSSSVYIRKLIRQQPHLARVEKGPTPACTSPALGFGAGEVMRSTNQKRDL
jgi:hypothetical protein